jgi:hypothetical protein
MLRANVTTSSRTDITWQTIEWRPVYRTINNLRRRFYRASAEGDLKRVHSLQKLMLYSKANKLAAIRQVTQQNQGLDKYVCEIHVICHRQKCIANIYRQAYVHCLSRMRGNSHVRFARGEGACGRRPTRQKSRNGFWDKKENSAKSLI